MLSNTISNEVTASLYDPALMLLDRGVYQVAAQSPQPLHSSCVIQADETAVADHVGIDDSDQLPPILAASQLGQMRCSPTYG